MNCPNCNEKVEMKTFVDNNGYCSECINSNKKIYVRYSSEGKLMPRKKWLCEEDREGIK